MKYHHGCRFYNGFSLIFALQQRGLMKGTTEQFQYIMCDEEAYASCGILMVKQIIHEEYLRARRDEAAETGYTDYIMQNPILGYSNEDH